MPFTSSPEVSSRLQKNPEPLTENEIREMFRFASVMQPGDVRVLEAQLALLTISAVEANRQAIRDFDESSTRLARRIYWLTWALVALTVVLTVFTILLWWKG